MKSQKMERLILGLTNSFDCSGATGTRPDPV